MEKFSTFATKLLGGTILAGGFAVAVSHGLDKQDEQDIVNQEGITHTEIPERFRDRVVHDVDCAVSEGGDVAVVSGGSLLEAPEGGSITASFTAVQLPLAIPSALGHCDVEIQDADGNVVDGYKVNAYDPSLVGPFQFNY